MPAASLIPTELADDALCKPSDLCKWLDVSLPTIDAWISRGLLPEPLKLGPRTRRWRVGDIRQAVLKLNGDYVVKRRKKK